jgi:hypothetical protein
LSRSVLVAEPGVNLPTDLLGVTYHLLDTGPRGLHKRCRTGSTDVSLSVARHLLLEG